MRNVLHRTTARLLAVRQKCQHPQKWVAILQAVLLADLPQFSPVDLLIHVPSRNPDLHLLSHPAVRKTTANSKIEVGERELLLMARDWVASPSPAEQR